MEEIKIKLTKEQLSKLSNNEAVIVLNLEPDKDVIKYPVFRSNIDNEIFRYDANGTKTKVLGSSTATISEIVMGLLHDPLMLDDKVPYNEHKGLYHMQPVFAWNDGISISKGLYFYNAVNDCVFHQIMNGKQYATKYFTNIQALTPDQVASMQQMIWDMYMNLIKMQSKPER